MQYVSLAQGVHLLPGRFGPRPRTTVGLPFRQIDQLPPIEVIGRLTQLARTLPGVRTRQSRMAAAGTIALALPGAAESGPPQAFIDGDEFCHLHTAPCGSLLLTLPAAEVEGVVALGWAERHPIHALGLMKSMVLVYAPRTREEVEIVVSLIEHSCRFALGLAAATPEDADAALQVL